MYYIKLLIADYNMYLFLQHRCNWLQLFFIHFNLMNYNLTLSGDSEVQRTMLELLNQLDGFEPKQNIKVELRLVNANCAYNGRD